MKRKKVNYKLNVLLKTPHGYKYKEVRALEESSMFNHALVLHAQAGKYDNLNKYCVSEKSSGARVACADSKDETWEKAVNRINFHGKAEYLNSIKEFLDLISNLKESGELK